MQRAPKPPTIWDRTRPYVVVAMLVLAALFALFGAFGLAAILFVVALGLGTFGGGPPKSGGFYESGIGMLGP